MRFATIARGGHEQAAVLSEDRWVPLDEIDPTLTGDLLALIALEWGMDRIADLAGRAADVSSSRSVARDAAALCPPYRHPRLIWGIGLNYAEHASDLHESQPADPASFVKGDHTIIGPGDRIVLPEQSSRVTTEAELGLIIGRKARWVAREDALDFVFGATPVLDQTAEDILEQNPRYLTRSKNFETFFAFGPEVITLDEFGVELSDVEVATVIDGLTVRRNRVGNMLHGPELLVSFHSGHMPMYPGDIISTGTPGAGVIRPGNRAEARIDGMEPLVVGVTEALPR